MRRFLIICLLAFIILNSAQAVEQTDGSGFSAEDITDFYYTYNWIGYNAEYLRYRFYADNGKHFFFHESRGTKDDYGWNTEDDVISSGTVELTEEQWAAFFTCLEGGTVKSRSEETLDGDSGPWMYLYLKGGDPEGLEYVFRSIAMQNAFVEFCKTLAAESLGKAGLVFCEYSISGGMENENISYTMAQAGDSRENIRLIVNENGKKKEYVLPGSAMGDLAILIAGFHPEKWQDLPDREYYALDAPDRRIEVKFEDGTEYSINDDKETEGPLFRDIEDFMRGYPAEE